jgi:hypothetical protein
MPDGWRTKEAAELARKVRRAGGTAEITGKGHIRVTGPLGSTVVASAPHGYGVALDLSRQCIEATGLVISQPVPKPKDGSRRHKPAGKQAAGNPPRRGVITRWPPGETCGFITEDGTGVSWFVSRDDLRPRAGGLPAGTGVIFNGLPDRFEPGKKYPRARSVRLAPEQQQEGES